MAKVCDYTTTAIVVLPDGTQLPLLTAGRSPQTVNVCRQWTEAVDLSAAGITASDLTEAFAWGFGVVTVFALLGWSVKTVRQVLVSTLKVDD